MVIYDDVLNNNGLTMMALMTIKIMLMMLLTIMAMTIRMKIITTWPILMIMLI